MKEFTQKHLTLVFYKKPGDEKFSFLVKDDEELTGMLNPGNKRRFEEKDIDNSVKGIFDEIKYILCRKERCSYEEVEFVADWTHKLNPAEWGFRDKVNRRADEDVLNSKKKIEALNNGFLEIKIKNRLDAILIELEELRGLINKTP